MLPSCFKVRTNSIHWYGLLTLQGILLGNEMAKRISKTIKLTINLNNLLTAIMIGIILGDRLGYVLFYDPPTTFLTHLKLLQFGIGMSFHGGALGAFLQQFMNVTNNT